MSASTTPRPLFSPARVAMVSLVSGALLVGGSSASLAVSGLSADGSAGVAQYLQQPPPPSGTTPDSGGVEPSDEKGSAPSNTTPSIQPPDDQGDVTPTGKGAGNPAQETRQVAAGGSNDRLPFTGLMALPLLLLGVAMLGSGFLLRRSASRRDAV